MRRHLTRRSCLFCSLLTAHLLTVLGCATITPQYAVRPTPTPDESPSALAIEREVSAVQGDEFDQQGSRRLGLEERPGGLPVQSIVDRLSQVTERPALHYRTYRYTDTDPNAAALADGRIYISSGMIEYLSGRRRGTDELAFVLGHELAHTVAQHLVKRFATLQRQQVVLGLIAAGASAVTQNASPGIQQAGRLAVDATSLLQDVALSGYSQDQELEADQLGIRYVIRAGFDPTAALGLLDDFARFDNPSPFLRTHPYSAQRRADLVRYLEDTQRQDAGAGSVPGRQESGGRPTGAVEEQRRRLRQLQQLYPKDSVSWNNLQRQMDALDR